MSGAVPGVTRGCGTRQKGGVYAETGLAANGMLLECFLVDPPRAITPPRKVGVELVEMDGVHHVLDWIGEEHYPYVTDFIEEVARFGLSRRMPKTLDFSKLSPQSKIICMHKRALLMNPTAYGNAVDTVAPSHCGERARLGMQRALKTNELERKAVTPEEMFHVEHPDVPCTRYWYLLAPGDDDDSSTRSHANVEYTVYGELDELVEPAWEPGVFAMFPLTRLVVIEDDDGSHHDTLHDIDSSGCTLPTAIEHE